MSMRTFLRVLGIVVAVAIVGGAAFFAFVWVSGGEGEPSAPVEAQRVEPAEPTSVVYEVDQARSEARFLIDEVLRGQQNTVIGTTDRIDGSIAIQFDPASVEIGEFVINVRTIATDDEVRDRTIRTLILESNRDEFEFSTFRPTGVSGVPEVVAPGVTLELEVTGDLTVRDVTRQVTFAMTIEVASQREITGSAETTITWDQFDITIPYVGGNSIVAGVADEVRLQLEFAAVAADS